MDNLVNQPLSAKPKRGQIGLAVLVAGAMATVVTLIVYAMFVSTLNADAAYLTPEQLLERAKGIDSFLVKFEFIAHLFIPLSCGFWAAFAWTGKHTRGNILLALCASCVTIVVGLFFALAMPEAYTFNPKEFLFAFSTAALFGGGALFADLIQERRSGRRSSDRTDQAQPLPDFLRLVAPSILTAVGTVSAAVISS
jgi:hypothetical protein